MARFARTPNAGRDVRGIWHYVAADNPVAAGRLIARIDTVCQRLAEFPKMGRPRPEFRPTGLRSFPMGNYVILYLEAPDGILVVRVLHAARDIPTVMDEDA